MMKTVIPAKESKMPTKSTAFSFLCVDEWLTFLSMGRGAHSFQSPSTFFKGIKKSTQHVVSKVNGRFMRNIHRQESSDLDERAPPMTGPIPFAKATTAPCFISQLQTMGNSGERQTRIPWYFPLSRSGTTSLTMSCATVIRPPPPMPVKARNTDS